MSMTFTKLASTLPGSSVWCAPYPTRIVWVTMLALCDQNGLVEASVPGLARIAGVTLEECKMALDTFLAPDEYSSSPEYDGRRIERIDRGWKLLNYKKYREARDEDARREYERNRKWNQRHKGDVTRCPDVSHDVPQYPGMSAQAEAEAEAEEDKTSGEVIHETKLSTPPPPEEELNSAYGARYVCDNLDFYGPDAMRLAQQVVEAVMQKQKCGGETAANWVVARWKAFQRSDIGKESWATAKHFLSQRVFDAGFKWERRENAEPQVGTRRESHVKTIEEEMQENADALGMNLNDYKALVAKHGGRTA